jgi:hypothetical protein
LQQLIFDFKTKIVYCLLVSADSELICNSAGTFGLRVSHEMLSVVAEAAVI